MPSTILDDVLIALEETAAEQFANEERCGLLLAAHNEIVRSRRIAARIKQDWERGKAWIDDVDNREDPEE